MTIDILDELREYEPDVDEKYVIDRAIAEIVRLRAAVGDAEQELQRQLEGREIEREMLRNAIARLAQYEDGAS